MTTTAVSLLFFIAISSSSITSRCSAFAPTRTGFVVTKPATSPPREESQFFSPLEPYVVFGRRQPESSTALQMGIRSFIKKKILRRNSDDQDSDDNESEEVQKVETEDVNLHALISSPESAGLMEGSPNPSTEDNKKRRKKEERKNSRDNNANEPAYSQEDIKQRIRRVKGGGMTEEEKMKFLNTALTRTSERKKPRGPPIRQQIPGMDDGDDSGSGSASKSSADKKLWDAITKKGGGGEDGPREEISVASLLMDGKLKNEQAKRQYIESITNPQRFSSFSAMKSTTSSSEVNIQYSSAAAPPVDDDVAEFDVVAAAEEEEDAEGGEPSVEDSSIDSAVEEDSAVDDTAESDFTRMKRQIAQDRELLNPQKKDDAKSEAKKAVESILSMISQNDKKKEATKNPTKDDALASRLEQAAVEQEKRDAESRLAAEKKREEEKRQREEQQRQREEEFRKKEEARMEAARQKAEDVRRREEEKIEAEKAGILARQRAQDDYWAKMLQKEQKKKGTGVTPDQVRMKEVATRDREEKMERDVASNVEMERIREEERLREDPHEGEILKQAADARTRDRERVRDIEVLAAARVSRTVPKPSNEDVSAASFIAEQRRKKEEIDRLRKFDVEQLKSMNSPLPSPGKMKRQPSVKPKIGQVSPTMYRAPPLAPATTTPRPPAPAPAQGLDLASLTMAKNKNQGSVASPPPSPPSSSVPPRLDLASLTMAKKTPPPPSPPSSSAPPRLDLASLTMAKNTPNAGAVKKPVKRVVRQRVQVADDYDDDDDDDDDLMRASPGMSIADAMRQQRKSGGDGNSNAVKSSGGGGKNISADDRAKQWGIDMSKFT